jgi:general secretion pathway protein H
MRGRRRSTAGVVLLDVVLALAIMALAAMTMVPRPVGGVSRADMRLAGSEIATMFRQGRSHAMATGENTDIRVDARAGRVAAPFRAAPYALPPGISADWVASNVCPGSGGRRDLRFLPDGRSCGGVVTLTGARLSAIIRVDWLTGRVDMDLP